MSGIHEMEALRLKNRYPSYPLAVGNSEKDIQWLNMQTRSGPIVVIIVAYLHEGCVN